MSEEKKIILAHDGMNPFSIYYPNPYTGKRETYKFPMYKPGSKRDRTIAVSEDCYQWLKDETTSFKEGYLRVVTENIPAAIKEQQEEAQQEVIDTTPEYEDNAITKEETEKIMKGTKATISKRLSKIETASQKQFVVDTIKELGINNIDKLREVVKIFYGEDMELDFVFPPTE